MDWRVGKNKTQERGMADMSRDQERALPIRVLVADDERPIRFLMEKELPRAG